MKASHEQRVRDERSTLTSRLDKLRELAYNKPLDEQILSHSRGMRLRIGPDGAVDVARKDGSFPDNIKQRKLLNATTYNGLESLIIANGILGGVIKATTQDLHVE